MAEDVYMEFPKTWEEFEKKYGFIDKQEVYTNGSRLIPCFRVKQWLDHTKTQKIEQSNFDIKQYNADLQNAYDCGKVSQEPYEDCISRQAVIELIEGWWIGHTKEDDLSTEIKSLPSVQPKADVRKMKVEVKETWRDAYSYVTEGQPICPWCGKFTVSYKKGERIHCTRCGKLIDDFTNTELEKAYREAEAEISRKRLEQLESEEHND